MNADGVFECVPNVSEGAHSDLIEELKLVASASAKIVDLHFDVDHGRSVFTLFGPKDGLVAAIKQLATKAIESIDITHHRGVHPRMGAIDVIPFVDLTPAHRVYNKQAAQACAEYIGINLEVPVFLYGGASANATELPDIRKRAFDPMIPDLGPHSPHPTAGAVAIGTRGPLVAFNVNLATDDIEVARDIASRIRESSGGLRGVRAIGLELASIGLTQVSCNLIEPSVTTMADVLDAVSSIAEKTETLIAGTELVGLAPREAFGGRSGKALRLSRYKVLEEELDKGVGELSP
ncbi:MAG: hypothetical protein ABR507_12335 [Actinomycetota bacterium]|nr:hypothetical protein [Actinomycetota bacterium]